MTDTHLYILRKLKGNNDEAAISIRRALNSVLKITSKKKTPELITFQYSVRDGKNFIITYMDRLVTQTLRFLSLGFQTFNEYES